MGQIEHANDQPVIMDTVCGCQVKIMFSRAASSGLRQTVIEIFTAAQEGRLLALYGNASAESER